MPYTLVSAATVGFDLVRLPAGRAVAEVLLAGLAADAGMLERLAERHPARGRDREQRGVVALRGRRARELAAAVAALRDAAVPDATAAGTRAAVLVAQLERGTIGDAAALERLLRDDVLGREHAAMRRVDPQVAAEATDVLADAAVGHWAAEVLPPLVRRELTAPFGRAVPDGAVPGGEGSGVDLGPAAADLAVLLGAVRGLDASGRAAWRAAVEEGRAERRPWASAMHQACWAAHVSGRTRSLAAAQLHAVQAFLDGGFGISDGAGGVWNAVAGCVQATSMADLLDDASLAMLLAPWRRVSPVL